MYGVYSTQQHPSVALGPSCVQLLSVARCCVPVVCEPALLNPSVLSLVFVFRMAWR